PLDLVGYPGENRTETQRKAEITIKRIGEAIPTPGTASSPASNRAGAFATSGSGARRSCWSWGIRYLAIGSLVPFFTREHNIGFAFETIRDARAATVMAPTSDALYDFIGKAVCGMPLF
ncbi:hypothetical protein HC891_24245, partial [Candidatus Gracilibacteria bacterium]|nr:hypothetical protein [Candidatus Gracilibacteria bacterium]